MFHKDLKFGKMLEKVFAQWSQHHDIAAEDISKRNMTYDFVLHDFVHEGTETKVDVKSYSGRGAIALEVAHNANKHFGQLKKGWLYTSEADIFCFINKKTLESWWLFSSHEFKKFYLRNRDKWPLRKNNVSYAGGNKWQSAFRWVPLQDLNEHVIGVNLKNNKEIK